MKGSYVQAERVVLKPEAEPVPKEHSRKSEPSSSSQSGGEADAKGSASQKAKKKEGAKLSAAGMNMGLAVKMLKAAGNVLNDLRHVNPIFMDARRIGGEMVEGSANSNIRKAAKTDEVNVNGASGSIGWNHTYGYRWTSSNPTQWVPG